MTRNASKALATLASAAMAALAALAALTSTHARADLVEQTAALTAVATATVATAGTAAGNNLSVTFDRSAAGQTVLGFLNLKLPGAVASGSGGSTAGSPDLGLSRPYLLTLNKNFELTLWNFVKTVGAQQGNLPIELASLNLNTLQLTLADEVAAVPLPAAGWLFVTGLLGLLGSRIKRRGASQPARLPALAAAA